MLKALRPVIHISRVTWQERGIVHDLVRRDFRLRYLGSLLGSYWTLLHPLAMIAIYTVIFSQVMKARIDASVGQHAYAYTIYLCAGLLPWNAFVEMVSRGTRVFLDNTHLIKKIAFPAEILPSIVAGSAAITFAISMALYLGVIVGVGHGLSWALVAIPLIFLLQTIFAVGLAMTLSVLNVFFRDVEQGVNILFQVWFWLTPIVYLENLVPEQFRWVFGVNPFYCFVKAYHQVAFFKAWPSAEIWMTCGIIAAGSFWLGAQFVSRFQGEIPDEV